MEKPTVRTDDHAAEEAATRDSIQASKDPSGAAMDASPETYAAIMAQNKPNPLGPGYRKLYILAGCVFLCSTMNGECQGRAGCRHGARLRPKLG